MKLLSLIIWLLCSFYAAANKYTDADIVAFCYHDVSQDILGKLDPDPNALNTQYLAHHFEWLKQNGYTVVSNQTIAQAKAGMIKLPAKAVSLSFDDGYESIYYHVVPLLEAFNYPATIGIVTNWIENQSSDSHRLEAKFMTWKQIKEISDSPLIEIASHSHDLHHGLLANPQGNTQPAATSRVYDPEKGYETTAAYTQRIKKDLQKSKDLIFEHTQKQVTTLIWPYGSYSEEAWQVAKSIGYTQSMTLDQGQNKLHGSEHLSRYLISQNPATHEFKSFFKPGTYQQPKRVVHVDLDYVYDVDPVQENANLSVLLERIKKMSVSTVFLQAFADPDGDGNADSLYFNNSVMPVRADLFNRVAWQLRTRAGVSVYAWMPISSFILSDEASEQWQVQSWQNNQIADSKGNYKRLSIFHPKAQAKIIEIYRDLGRYNQFAGLLFHDDGLLTDYEDLSQDAIKYYQDNGLSFTHAGELINNKQLAEQWARLKTQALIDFTQRLTAAVKYYQPEIKTARNMYAMPVLNPESEKWFAQDLTLFTENYDLTAIMAMPYLEKAASSQQWLEKLLDAVRTANVDQKKVLFELQAKDWHTKKPVPTSTLVQQMKQLQQAGFPNYGYYPDDFINDQPVLIEIKPHMSLNDFPHERK